MPGRPPYDFVYVHTDIPEGMTIREWRAHARERGDVHCRARAAVERRRATRCCGCTPRGRRPRFSRHEASG